VIVFPDVDLDKVIPKAAIGFAANSGQACISTNRVYVHESIAEEFVSKMKTHLEELYSKNVGDPLQGAVLGPQADRIQYQNVLKFLEEGKKSGAKLILGGGRHGDKGYFIQPTIFQDVFRPWKCANCQAPEDSYIMKNESFAPIAQVNSFSSEEEVLAKANDSEFGLYASVFTRDLNRALRFAKELESGQVAVNAASPTFSITMPFGGWKQSGIGSEYGIEGLDHWSQMKSVYISMDE